MSLEDVWDLPKKYKMSDDDTVLLRKTVMIGLCAVDIIKRMGLGTELEKAVEDFPNKK